jgi:hypothetical protein
VTTARQRRWPPVVIALSLQAVAAVATVATARVLGARDITLGTLGAAILMGVIAGALSVVARLDWWWVLIQVVFAPALLIALVLAIPRWVLLTLIVLLVLVYWSTFRTQVPLYLSSSAVRAALVPLLPSAPAVFLDVGSGIGGVLTYLADRKPEHTYHGIESAPLPWFVSWMRVTLRRRKNCHARFGSLWNCDLRDYDVVFAYLSPVPMAALWEKVVTEMRPGSVFISNSFAVDAVPPTHTVTVDDAHRSTLYVWQR